MFPITWNVIAMEAAACYVGECRNGPRDAKIALTAEGVYGMLIYILTPLVFVGVLGAALSSSDLLTLYTDFTTALFGHGSWIKWIVGLPLILALLLSVLNAIMGTGRSLYQASQDGALPHWFGKVNTHGVPARAMAFNVVASMLVVLFGSPVRIYIFSNAGYLFACAMSLAGYFVYRPLRPAAECPLRLPGWVRYVALAIFLFWAVVYFYGGWNAPNIVVAPNSGPVLFILGLVVMSLYFPLYYWRKRSDQRRTRLSRPRQPRFSPRKRHEAALAAGERAGGAAPWRTCCSPPRASLSPTRRSPRPGDHDRPHPRHLVRPPAPRPDAQQEGKGRSSGQRHPGDQVPPARWPQRRRRGSHHSLAGQVVCKSGPRRHRHPRRPGQPAGQPPHPPRHAGNSPLPALPSAPCNPGPRLTDPLFHQVRLTCRDHPGGSGDGGQRLRRGGLVRLRLSPPVRAPYLLISFRRASAP